MQLNCYTSDQAVPHIPVLAMADKDLAGWLASQPGWCVNYINAINFQAKPGNIIYVPTPEKAELYVVLLGVENIEDMWCWGNLATLLPPGSYEIANTLSDEQLRLAAIAWGLGAYQFTRYKKACVSQTQLFISKQVNREAIEQSVGASYLARDLINTPAQDMGPVELAEAASVVANNAGAILNIVDDLTELQVHYPAVYAVGKASERKPRVVEFVWGNEQHPKISLVGKGVCFDTGGLNIKTGQSMRLMKKDMGGAAHALALAQWLMQAKLPIRLHVLLPLVENSIGGNAFRPGDVIQTRKGLTVEIDNTDAEGRLILCDALTRAVEERPELLIDFATLTGAARVALGPDIPALFSNNQQIANDLISYAQQEQDPLWQLPLHRPYRDLLKSTIADLSNSASSPFAGAITAALFLQEFVPTEMPWVHFDVMAWNLGNRSGRPEGGEALALRAIFRYLKERYAQDALKC